MPGKHRGERVIGHTGAWEGYRAYAGRFPDRDLGVVVLSNDESFDAQGVAMRVADAYLDVRTPPPEPSPSARADVDTAPRIEAAGSAAGDPSAYAGRYASVELGVTYEVVVRGDALAIKIPRHDDLPLKPVGSDHFAGFPLDRVRADYRYQRDPAGRVTGFRVTFLGVRNLRFDRQGP